MNQNRILKTISRIRVLSLLGPLLVPFLAISAMQMSSQAYAAVTACVWQPDGQQGMKLLVPAADGQDCKTAVQRYVDAVNSNSDLRNGMMKGGMVQIPSNSNYYQYNATPTKKGRDAVRFLILTNEFDQMQTSTFQPSLFTRLFQNDLGADLYFLPVAADIGLPNFQAGMDFRGIINRSFDAMLALGGEDINPQLYGQNPYGAHLDEIHPVRDAKEIEYHKSYISGGKGVFYAICRGHQLAAVSQGQSLYQDVYTDSQLHFTKKPDENSNWNEIQLAQGSLLSNFLGGKTSVFVFNSRHEAVRPLQSKYGFAQLNEIGTEYDANGNHIIEAIQGSNGRYLSFQFHPEAMENGDGYAIRKGMVDYASSLRK